VRKGDIIAYMNNSRDQTKKRQLQTGIEQAKLQLIEIYVSINMQITYFYFMVLQY